jgi:hypothetical protein
MKTAYLITGLALGAFGIIYLSNRKKKNNANYVDNPSIKNPVSGNSDLDEKESLKTQLSNAIDKMGTHRDLVQMLSNAKVIINKMTIQDARDYTRLFLVQLDNLKNGKGGELTLNKPSDIVLWKDLDKKYNLAPSSGRVILSGTGLQSNSNPFIALLNQNLLGQLPSSGLTATVST